MKARADTVLTALMFAALAAQVGAFIVSSAATFDEPAEIGAGYSYVRTGKIALETHVHPPLMKYLFGLAVAPARPSFDAGSPALTEDQPYAFGLDFVFHNRIGAELILTLARLPSLLLSLALAACLTLWARSWFGPWGGVLALAAYAFEPNVLAHSGLANMDLGLTAFLFAAYWALVGGRTRWAGPLAGLALGAKLPGVFFLAWSTLFSAWRLKKLLPVVRTQLIVAGWAALALAALYQLRYLPLLHGLLSQMLPAIFVKGHPTEPQLNFLLGATKIGGWPHYYLVALAVKTSLPFLALVGLGFARGLDRKERVVLGIPVISWLLVCSLASKQNGIRYVLPVFPFLCLAVGSLARERGRAMRGAVAALLLWSIAETFSVAPRYLAYFNELAGGPAGGHRVLVDSNLDWGQDMLDVGELLRRGGSPETIVATLGIGDRDHYLGPHQDLLAWEPETPDPEHYRRVNPPSPAREWLIVSASLLHGFGLTDPDTFAWLRAKAPIAQPGFATFVYDVTNDALSQFNVGKIYMRNGRHQLARRQFARAAALDPARALPLLALGDACAGMGDAPAARAAWTEGVRRARAAKDNAMRAAFLERMSRPRT